MTTEQMDANDEFADNAKESASSFSGDTSSFLSDIFLSGKHTEPEVDVQLSLTFTAPAIHLPTILKEIVSQLPLTVSVELELTEHTELENRS